MTLSGVRSSCDMVATNSDLSRFASWMSVMRCAVSSATAALPRAERPRPVAIARQDEAGKPVPARDRDAEEGGGLQPPHDVGRCEALARRVLDLDQPPRSQVAERREHLARRGDELRHVARIGPEPVLCGEAKGDVLLVPRVEDR